LGVVTANNKVLIFEGSIHSMEINEVCDRAQSCISCYIIIIYLKAMLIVV